MHGTKSNEICPVRHMMSRLVQGDVGSGKTILAFLSMILSVAKWISGCIDGTY